MREKESLEEVMGCDAFAQQAGLEVLVAGAGYAEVRMAVTDNVKNGHGKVHGGALFTLADYAGAVASNFLGEPTMATDGTISFLRAVSDGHVIAKARTVKSGRRINFQSVELFNAEGELVALFQGGAIRIGRPAKLG